MRSSAERKVALAAWKPSCQRHSQTGSRCALPIIWSVVCFIATFCAGGSDTCKSLILCSRLAAASALPWPVGEEPGRGDQMPIVVAPRSLPNSTTACVLRENKQRRFYLEAAPGG